MSNIAMQSNLSKSNNLGLLKLQIQVKTQFKDICLKIFSFPSSFLCCGFKIFNH